MKEYWVYILRCRDGSYYTGVTNNIAERVQQHEEGYDPSSYTFTKRPVKLVYQRAFREILDAIKAEKQIQGWSRKKKEALITNNLNLLHSFAMSSEKKKRLQIKQARDASSSPFGLRSA